ncbi:MAG TPA: ABC transporter ATP-binding protein/permease [Firmicutes bacterium]|nr:ABC transporter ATP-binding protein/permease [Bacillota bacterium]
MIRILKNFKWYYWLMLALMLLIIVGQVQLDLIVPEYMSQIVSLVTTPGSEMSEIWRVGLIMIACAFGSLVCTVLASFIAARMAAGFAELLRDKVFRKVESFSMNEINKFSTASLITRCTNDVQQIQTFITIGLRLLITAPIMAIGAIVKMSGKSGELTLLTFAGVLVIVVFVLFIYIVAVPRFKSIQKLTDRINKVTRENLTGLRVVRAYNAEAYQEEKFDKANTAVTKTYLFVNRVLSLMQPVMQIVMNGLSLGIVWLGATLINANVLELPTMMSFTMYSMQVILSFLMLIMVFIFMPRASVSSKRINEVLSTKNIINDPETPAADTGIKGELEFRNVSFKYPDGDGYVLKDISFKAEKGQTFAIIGSTGSGKSSLLNLIPRFYDVTEGEVLVDGVNVKEYRQEELHDKIGYVPQKAVLFSGTVDSNLRFGKEDATREELAKAVKIAQANNIIEKKGYGGNVAQGGQNMSGGQKQRMSIARAIVKNPEIYLFDDSFSALDYKTDRLLREAINKNIKDATNIIVAQRIGTIKNADRILVLDDGRVVGDGTHEELLANCSVYQEIAHSQLSKEELANG